MWGTDDNARTNYTMDIVAYKTGDQHTVSFNSTWCVCVVGGGEGAVRSGGGAGGGAGETTHVLHDYTVNVVTYKQGTSTL